VRLVENPAADFNEPDRQRLLIETARDAVPGPRILIALDADEALTANVLDSPEWRAALAAPAGTVLDFEWVIVHPDGERCWIPNHIWSWGYVDDGAPHAGLPIHSPRVPVPSAAPHLRMRDVKVFHFAHTDPARLRSRHRWYQCWERLNVPELRATEQYRQYHQFGQVDVVRPIPPAWRDAYRRAAIDLTSAVVEGRYRWDALVLQLLRDHGAAPFRRVDMWDVDWKGLASSWGMSPRDVPGDPRSVLDRLVLRYLERTQGRQDRMPWFHIDRALRLIGW
jgi:hypothetical protein